VRLPTSFGSRIGSHFRDFLSTASFRADQGLGIVGTPSPDSDYWYHGLGHRSAAGPNVSPGTATRLAAVFACTRVCTETLSSLPIAIFRERKSGGRDLATDHPAQELFLRPNQWQTGMEFFEMMQGHLELRGNAYALKIPGNGRAIDQLLPLHPDRVRVYLLPNNRLRYEVTAYSTGRIDRYVQDEILHLRAWSFDGIMGISTVSALAEVIGVGLAQQEHRARYFRNNAIPGMSVETTKQDDEKREQLANSIEERFSSEGAFKVMVLPPGMTVKMLGLTNRDSQLIEASGATRVELCGAWRVPPHKIGDLSRGTFSNIEQQNIEFATDCMRPRIIRLERRLDQDIVGSLRAFESSPGDYFAVFNMDALYRGDMKSRFEAYGQAVTVGWMVRNEARAAEGRNPIAGLDEPLVAVNLETVKQAQARSDANVAAMNSTGTTEDEENDEAAVSGPGSAPTETPEASPGEDKQQARLQAERVHAARFRLLALTSAGRIVRREVKQLRRLAGKAHGDVEHDVPGPAIEGEVWAFYRDLAPVVAEALAIPAGMALMYCTRHATLISAARGVLLDQAIDSIEQQSTEQLAELARGAKGASFELRAAS
jgi:HK97 family phage portal protein